jgi:hypothetical protein
LFSAMANQQKKMSSSLPLPVSSQLLKLPDELLLKITLYLPRTVNHTDPQGDLLSLASTCKRLTPFAREALLQTPALLSMLFKYPDLGGKIRSLAIESKETRGQQAEPTPIPTLDVGLLRDCEAYIRTLLISNRATKHAWIADIKRNKFSDPSSLLCVLFTLLPKLTELYLGGSTLIDFPLFRVMLPSVVDAKLPDAWLNAPNLLPVLRLLGPKLRVLELPNSFHVSRTARAWQVPDISGIPTYFPNLIHLSVSSNAVYDTACWDIVGRKLERLTLTDAGDPDVDNWVGDLPSRKPQHFPNLTKVELYCGRRVLSASQYFRDHMLKSGIECTYRPAVIL